MTDELLFNIIEPGIAQVTLNRPEKRNAISPAIAEGLDAAVKRTEADPAIRVTILGSSHPGVFCAGADLATVAAGEGPRLSTRDGGFAGFAYARRSKPWIAAISGTAVAGGCEIALSCDLIVAGPEAKFGLPEPKRGLLAGAGGVTRLPRRIPLGVATELILTGDTLDAQRAYMLGLVCRLTDTQDAVIPSAVSLARSIAANAPVAVQESLELARQAAFMTDKEARDASEAALARLRLTEDFKEGPRAFLEKRTPNWKGC